MGEIKLEPCPFCGGTNIKLFVFNCGTIDYIRCEDCRITIEVIHDVKIKPNDIKTRKRVLATKWNTRIYKEETKQ